MSNKENKNTDKKAAKEEKKAAKKVRKSLKARAFKRGWFSVVLVVLCIVAVVVVNMITATLVEKIPALVIDTTGSDNFELSTETTDFLNTLDEKITIYALAEEQDFRSGGDYYVQACSLLNKYGYASDMIDVQYIDLSSNPTFDDNFDEEISSYNVIVQGENEYKYLTSTDMFEFQYDTYYGYSYIVGSKVEEAVTSAILNVTLDEKPKAAFISDISLEDYTAYMNMLENNGFETEEVSPALGVIPEDASILVLYAPSVDLDSSFVDTISDFLYNNGEYGKQLIYLPSASLQELPNIDSLLEEWGLDVEEGYAIENDSNYTAPLGGGYYLYAAQYSDSTYTANMKNADLPYCTLGGYTKAVTVLDDSKASSLITLSEQSQMLYPVTTETEDQASEDVEYVDVPNVNIAAIATKSSTSTVDTDTDTDSSATETKSSNIVVIATSVSMSESTLSSSVYGNSSYMLSLLNTLTGRGDVDVNIAAVSLESDELGITSAQIYTLGAIFIIAVPVIVLIAGIVIFIKRKNM